MKKNLYLIIVDILIIGLAVGLPFAFMSWNNMLVANNAVLVLYIISKVVFGLILLCSLVWTIVKIRARGHVYMLMCASIIVQAAPLLIRTSVYVNGFVLGFAILMLALFLIAYVGFAGLVLSSNKKQVRSDIIYQGKEIAVVDEETAEKRNKEKK